MSSYLILCHNPKSLISKGIRFFTKSKWNHGAILYNSNVYEFNGNGKVVTPYNDWSYKGTTKFIPIQVKTDPNLITGKYDFGVFVNEVLFYITKLEFFSNRDNPKKWFCFEFCSEVMGLKNSYKATGKTFETLI